MEEYFKTHISDIIYGGIVIVAMVTHYLLTTLIHKWIIKRRSKRFPTVDPTPINRVKRILNTLWIVLGLIALNFIFIEEEEYGAMNDHFK